MGDEAAPAPAAEPAKTTTSGAQGLLQTNAWLTAAAVALYSTQALWVKLRKMGLGRKKSKNNNAEKVNETDEETVTEESLPENSLENKDDIDKFDTSIAVEGTVGGT